MSMRPEKERKRRQVRAPNKNRIGPAHRSLWRMSDMGALQEPCRARTMSGLRGRRRRALIGVIADDR